MTDSRVREAERRWRQSGRAEDEAALLRERLRAGALSASRLRLMAHCGHTAARLATGEERPAPARLEELADGLGAWGNVPCSLAVLAAAQVTLESVRASIPPEEWATSAAALEGLAAWTACPCPEHAHVLAERAEVALLTGRAGDGGERTGAGSPACFCAVSAAHVAGATGADAERQARLAMRLAGSLLDEPGRARALEAARAALLTWAGGDEA